MMASRAPAFKCLAYKVWGPLVSRDQSSRSGGGLSRRDRESIPARTSVPELIRHKFISTKGCLA